MHSGQAITLLRHSGTLPDFGVFGNHWIRTWRYQQIASTSRIWALQPKWDWPCSTIAPNPGGNVIRPPLASPGWNPEASYWLTGYIDLFRAILNFTTNSAWTAKQCSHLCCTDTASEAGLPAAVNLSIPIAAAMQITRQHVKKTKRL